MENAKKARQTAISSVTVDFEAKLVDMQKRHQIEIDELTRQALADVSGAEKRAEILQVQLTTLKAESSEIQSIKSQLSASEKNLKITSIKLGETEKKLADFLSLYGEERKVLEESRKVAEDLDRIKRRYATTMEIDEDTIDQISNKVETQLALADDAEKLQAMMDGKSKGDTVRDVNNIPVWAYYALGVATAILPRIISGGL